MFKVTGRQHGRARDRECPADPARSETPRTRARSMRENRESSSPPADHGAAGRSGKAMRRTPLTHGEETSDGAVVPTNPSNKAGRPAAERGEGRASAEGNADQQTTRRTQSRVRVPSALDRVRQVAKRDRRAKFTALLHHVTVDLLRQAYLRTRKEAAPGIDGMTWAQYGERLEDNLRELHDRLHRGAYRVKPSRRTYIPKADGRPRPLGIAALEDKIVQRAIVEVMNAVYEVDFLGFSYGFRPGRGQHQALDALAVGITTRKVSYVLDADIRGFFDAIDHGWLLKFVEHRIADKRVLRLLRKWLAAGVMENGSVTQGVEGTPQGATISPLLANVYLHYVFDLWAQQWRKARARGEMIVVRYADDFLVGFQHHADAERFLSELRERLRRFALELHPDKTRLLAFGRFAARQRRERGERGSPEIFHFLGFTHVCGRTRQGSFGLVRRTMASRMRAKLKEVKAKLMRRRHRPIAEQGAWLGQVVRGHFAYYAVPTNIHALKAFRAQVQRHWRFALSRRSQRGRVTWERMNRLAARWLPPVRIAHPWPSERFAVRTQGRSRVR